MLAEDKLIMQTAQSSPLVGDQNQQRMHFDRSVSVLKGTPHAQRGSTEGGVVEDKLIMPTA